MSKRIKNDAGCYCEKAQYIDEYFVCMITGQSCIFKDNPNQYECYNIYNKYKRSERNVKYQGDSE